MKFFYFLFLNFICSSVFQYDSDFSNLNLVEFGPSFEFFYSNKSTFVFDFSKSVCLFFGYSDFLNLIIPNFNFLYYLYGNDSFKILKNLLLQFYFSLYSMNPFVLKNLDLGLRFSFCVSFFYLFFDFSLNKPWSFGVFLFNYKKNCFKFRFISKGYWNIFYFKKKFKKMRKLLENFDKFSYIVYMDEINNTRSNYKDDPIFKSLIKKMSKNFDGVLNILEELGCDVYYYDELKNYLFVRSFIFNKNSQNNLNDAKNIDLLLLKILKLELFFELNFILIFEKILFKFDINFDRKDFFPTDEEIFKGIIREFMKNIDHKNLNIPNFKIRTSSNIGIKIFLDKIVVFLKEKSQEVIEKNNDKNRIESLKIMQDILLNRCFLKKCFDVDDINTSLNEYVTNTCLNEYVINNMNLEI